ncbi:L,D-transpeptidase family protein [Marinobacter piscensis]|uniref:L,D-transpeptidase family protein n=1 Tax=Marinobacter piscensis TaxID=1562308 RepID=UPI00119F740B|nr:L,D-transpeptidase family protein [Marinobacter piscensis]
MTPGTRVIAASISILLLLLLTPATYASEDDRILFEALADRLPAEQADLQDFYAARQGRPAWQHAETVAGFAAALSTIESDGLNAADYRPDALMSSHRQLQTQTGTLEDHLRLELRISRTLMTVLHHLQRGKVDPYSVDPEWETPITAPSLNMQAISQAVDAQRFEQAFALARPEAAPYQRLRAGLAQYRQLERQGGWPRLPVRQRPIRPGDTHKDVALLRKRLLITGEPATHEYTDHLVDAVRRFQRHHLLEEDGVVGRRTRAALNVPVTERINQIRVNLERARWLLHGEAEEFVLVDIAGYRISYFRPNGEIWRSRIVVGQPYRRTPSLRSMITHLTINPTWTVPPTILNEDMLPKIRHDSTYLDRQNISVLNFSGQQLDPDSIDWWNPGGIMLRQGPGPTNALGQVVLRFPNNHMVYLHDTPSQGLFSRQQRAFSSGCIRVQGVFQLAQMLFEDTGTQADVDSLIAEGKTRNIHLKRSVPVILHYWTVHPGQDGELIFRPDVYQQDARLLKALDQPFMFPGPLPALH